MRNPAPINRNQSKTCVFTDLGAIDVPTVEGLMTRAVELRLKNEIPDLLLFLSHPPTVALGLKDRCVEMPVDLLVSRAQLDREGILFTRSVRGGGITYHWPGQVVCYPVLALNPGERDAPAYMAKLEEIGLRTLQEFGIRAARRRDAASYVGIVDRRQEIGIYGGSNNSLDHELRICPEPGGGSLAILLCQAVWD